MSTVLWRIGTVLWRIGTVLSRIGTVLSDALIDTVRSERRADRTVDSPNASRVAVTVLPSQCCHHSAAIMQWHYAVLSVGDECGTGCGGRSRHRHSILSLSGCQKPSSTGVSLALTPRGSLSCSLSISHTLLLSGSQTHSLALNLSHTLSCCLAHKHARLLSIYLTHSLAVRLTNSFILLCRRLATHWRDTRRSSGL